jgi:hypothetical protein
MFRLVRGMSGACQLVGVWTDMEITLLIRAGNCDIVEFLFNYILFYISHVSNSHFL